MIRAMSLDAELVDRLNTFWTEFDSKLNPGMPPDQTPEKDKVNHFLSSPVVGYFSKYFDRRSRTLNFEKFKEDTIKLQISDVILDLANVQVELFSEYLGDQTLAQTAFECFGQGVLYDTNNDELRTAYSGETKKYEIFRVHMADATGVYGFWHAFIRAACVLGTDEATWIEFDKLVALAYLIHSRIKPIQSFKFPRGDSLQNVPLKQRSDWMGIEKVLEECRPMGLINSFEKLDHILGNAFFGYYPFNRTSTRIGRG
jgi:hypothetical protein